MLKDFFPGPWILPSAPFQSLPTITSPVVHRGSSHHREEYDYLETTIFLRKSKWATWRGHVGQNQSAPDDSPTWDPRLQQRPNCYHLRHSKPAEPPGNHLGHWKPAEPSDDYSHSAQHLEKNYPGIESSSYVLTKNSDAKMVHLVCKAAEWYPKPEASWKPPKT